MKNKKVLTISILPIMWSLYILFELVTGRITDFKTIFFNIILILLFAIVGLVTYTVGIRNESGFNSTILLFLFIFFGGRIILIPSEIINGWLQNLAMLILHIL